MLMSEPAAVRAPAAVPRETRYLERSRLLYVTVGSTAAGAAAVRTCAFEGGRVTSAAGDTFLWSGPLRRRADLRLPDPAPPAPAEEAAERVARLVGSWAGTANVQYLARSSHRAVLTRPRAVAADALVESSVWALLGNVVTSHGRVVPVGLSGRGSGLPELEREAESGELARMLSRIDGSRPLPAGTVAAVLAPPAAGVLVHEAVGHFAEAAPEGRADLTHRLGLRVASEGFDLVDDPLVAAGPASYRVDDE